MIKKILVPVDGSESANRALDVALDLAQRYSAEIHVMTVVQYPSELDEGILNTAAIFERVKSSYEKVLSEAFEKAKTVTPNLKVTSELTEGYPADIVVETAREGSFDIIVMGRRGRSHLRHTLLGSVSDRVADQSPCMLLLIK